MTINEFFRNRINRIITEEYGINAEFDEKVKKAIKSIISNLKGKHFAKEGNCLTKKHTEVFEINGKKVTIQATNYYFETMEKWGEYMQNNDIPCCYLPTVQTIYIPLITVGNQTDYDDFSDAIYHELEHFFKDTFLNGPKMPSSKYIKAISNIGSKDEIEKRMSEIIYCADRNEQDSMINGLWGQANNYDSIDEINTAINNSEAALWIKKLYANYDFLKKTNIEEKYLKGKAKESFLNFTLKVIKSFEKKFARIVFKIKKDKIINEGIRPYISAKHRFKIEKMIWI